jgi:predicted ATPase/serine/threonine protein kinase
MPPRRGQQYGHYLLGGLLGSGGMADVWAATHVVLGVPVAVKVLYTGVVTHQARLLREGRVQAAMDHDNVLPVRDVVDIDGALGLVLPLVDGPALDDLLAETTPDVEAAVAIFRAILNGVSHAHHQGLVHRDLKPGNVLLHATRGRIVPKIADFGLVKVDDGAQNRAGRVMGTLGYAAPEQLRDADAVDHRADLYALGAVLYRLLAGRRAFAVGTLAAYRSAQMHGADLSCLPQGSASLIERLLQPSPEDRPDSCEAVAAALDGVFAHPDIDPLLAGGPVDRAMLSARTSVAPRSGTPTDERGVPTTMADDEAHDGGSAVTSDLLLSDSDPLESPNNLPLERDAFMGRSAALTELGGLLAGGALVSVLGPGGSGKTRFVLHYAWSNAERFPGGVYFCDLSDARSVMDIGAAVARGLSVDLGKGDPIGQLGSALAALDRALVVLDNFEQVVGFAAETLGRWVGRLGGAKLVVTSRALLGVAGERVVTLPIMEHESAVDLFVDRARAVAPALSVDGPARRAIAELVDMLDRLPLAIELAAARSRVLKPDKLLSRMGQRFRLLSAPGRRDRQATLRATLDWSWDLLQDWERAALAQLSVFEGGFSLEAAEDLLELSDSDIWPLDAVQSLVDRSLVRVVSDDRFDLLMSIREYASEKLHAEGAFAHSGPDAVQACWRRHGAHYARFGTAPALRALTAHGGVALLRALALEGPNLSVACTRAAELGDGGRAAQTALAAWSVLRMKGPLSVGLALLEGAVPDAGEHGIRVRLAAARACIMTGGMAAAADHIDRARALAVAAQDPVARGQADAMESMMFIMQGRLDLALRCSERALQLHEPSGDRRTLGTTLTDLGLVCHQQGQMEEAEEHYRRALGLLEAVGDRPSEARVLFNLGLLHYQLRRADTASDFYRRARVVYREMGDRRSEGRLQGNLGNLAVQQGQPGLALKHLRKARSIHREIGDRRVEGRALGNIGLVHHQQGRNAEAKQCFDGALAIHREVGNRPSEGVSLACLGLVHHAEGRLDQAGRLLEQALAIHREVGNRSAQGQVLTRLGVLYHQQGLLDDAHGAHEQALALHRSVRDPVSAAVSNADLGLLLARRGHTEEGRERLVQAAATLRERNDPLQLGLTLCSRVKMERLAGDEHAAARALDEAAALAARLNVGPQAELSLRLSALIVGEGNAVTEGRATDAS